MLPLLVAMPQLIGLLRVTDPPLLGVRDMFGVGKLNENKEHHLSLFQCNYSEQKRIYQYTWKNPETEHLHIMTLLHWYYGQLNVELLTDWFVLL